MLILSRRVGETIAIKDNIKLTILSVRGRQVRVGFTAPKEIVILRKELCIPDSNQERQPVSNVHELNEDKDEPIQFFG